MSAQAEVYGAVYCLHSYVVLRSAERVKLRRQLMEVGELPFACIQDFPQPAENEDLKCG